MFRTLQVSRATLGGLRVWPPSPSIVRPCRGVCRGCLPCLGLSDIPQCGWPTFCVSVLPRQTRLSPPRTFRQFVTDAAVNIRASSAWACVSFLASVNPGAPSLGCVVTPRVAPRGAARRFGRSALQCVSFCTGRRGDLRGAVGSPTEVRTGGSRPRQGGVSGRPGGPRGGVGAGSVRSESSSLLGHEGGERASRAPRAPRLRASGPRPGPALSRPALCLAALDPLTPPSASFPQTRHALRAPSAHSALPRVCPPPRLLDQDSEAEEQEGPTRSPKVLSSSGTSRVISRSSPVPGGGSGRPCGRRRAGLPRRARVRAQVPGVGEGCMGGDGGVSPAASAQVARFP